MPEGFDEKLRALSPDARRRVEEALSRTLEAEISGLPGTDPAASFSRSKGLAFSRSKCLVAAGEHVRWELDSQLVRKVETMEEAAFERFAARLSALRSSRR